MDRTLDNNYTANFQSSGNSAKWQNDLIQAVKNGWTYRVRIDSDKEDLRGYNEPVS